MTDDESGDDDRDGLISGRDQLAYRYPRSRTREHPAYRRCNSVVS